MISSVYRKGTQALNYFSRKKDGQINKMKAIKLIYLADRFHLRKYGRPVVGDVYWAMKLGPVGSHALDLANLSESGLDRDSIKYAKEFIAHPKDDTKKRYLASKREVDMGVFSQTDLEALEMAYKEFGDKDDFELAEKITHVYPEWLKHKGDIDKGTSRVRMNYEDFFLNPKGVASDVFAVPEEHLKVSKEIFLEHQEALAALK